MLRSSESNRLNRDYNAVKRTVGDNLKKGIAEPDDTWE